MSLVKSTLKTELVDTFTDFGADIPSCAAKWADAIAAYFSPVVPPSANVAAAKGTLQTQLAAAFALPSAATAMDAAFTAFALTVGGGMAPTFVAVPPPLPVGWALLFAEPYPASADAAAEKISTVLDAWARTGTATPSIGGSPSPWS
jgi:hypothetical protein